MMSLLHRTSHCAVYNYLSLDLIVYSLVSIISHPFHLSFPILTLQDLSFSLLQTLIFFSMESGHHVASTNSSSEEVDQPEQDTNDLGTGRSYKCVFCKRGFTTAQALGGHMNIHRKDRAKNRSHHNSINQNKPQENYSSPKLYHAISSYPLQNFFPDHEAQVVSYRTYFPAATPSETSPLYVHRGNEFCGKFLNLQFGPPPQGGEEKREDELDLELRLGHNP